jgi:hypothetical protein
VFFKALQLATHCIQRRQHRLEAQVPFPDILLWCCFCFRNSCCFSSNKRGKATSQRSGIVTQGKLPYAEPNGFTRQVANDPQQSENSSEGQEENSDNLNPDSSAKVVAPVSASSTASSTSTTAGAVKMCKHF